MADPFSHPPSLSLLFALFLSLSCFSLLEGQNAAAWLTVTAAPWATRAGQTGSKGLEIMGPSFLAIQSQSLAAVNRAWEATTKRWRIAVLRQVLTAKLSANKFLLTSSSKWYLLFPTKVLGPYIRISIQKWQTLLVDPSQNGALFWGNDIEFILVTKITLQQYIIYLCLKLLSKRHVFRDNQWIDNLKLCLVLRAWPTRLRVKIWDHS